MKQIKVGNVYVMNKDESRFMIVYGITDEQALIWDADYMDDVVCFMLEDMEGIIEGYGYRRLRGKRKMSGSPGPTNQRKHK